MKSRFFITCLALASIPAARAALVITTDNVALDIPDGSGAGLARNISVLTATGHIETITSVTVSVEITASPGKEGFLGDLYIFITNGTDTSVLINRAGRSLTAPGGYGDDQDMNVTFTNLALNDIHTYRDVLTGNATTPLINPLTGSWLPDGRPTDPANVLTSDLPSARLDQFVGSVADGDWSLFVADMSGGGEHRLVSWTLTLNTVPEPSALLLTLGAVPLLLRRRR